MCDDEHSYIRPQFVNPFHDGGLGIPIKCTSCLVKDQHISLSVQGSCNTDTLTLSSGKPDPALANGRLVGAIQPFDEVMDSGASSGLFYANHVDSLGWLAKSDVCGETRIREKDALWHMGNACLPMAEILRF